MDGSMDGGGVTGCGRRGAAGYGLPVLFGFRGRIGRVQFALSMACQMLLTAVLTGVFLAAAGGGIIAGLIDAMAGDFGQIDFSDLYKLMAFGAAVEVLLSTAMFWSLRARMHDLGLSVWWSLPMAVPMIVGLAGLVYYGGVNGEIMQTIGTDVSSLLLFLLAVVPGNAGANAYGPPPLSPPPRTSAQPPALPAGPAGPMTIRERGVR